MASIRHQLHDVDQTISISTSLSTRIVNFISDSSYHHVLASASTQPLASTPNCAQSLPVNMSRSPQSAGEFASSRSNSLASFGRITDERDFDRLAPNIPNSQAANTLASDKPAPRRFAVVREELSESVLSEGFSWPVKRPPCPVQFSQPNHPPSQASPSRLQLANFSFELPPHAQSPNNSSQPLRKRVPLDLPELGLAGNTSSIRPSATSTRISETHGFTSKPSSQDDFPAITSPQKLSSDSSAPQIPRQKNSHNQPRKASQIGIRPHLDHQASLPQSTAKNTVLGHFEDGVKRIKSTPSSNGTENKSPEASYNQSLTNHCVVTHPSDLKVPLPRQTSTHESQRSHLSSSVCGDLERPTAQTPRSSKYSSSETQRRITNHPACSPRHESRVAHNRARSRSRASNISRKRSTIQKKKRSRTDPERKKEAMSHVARYWNECIQISEDERREASREIDQLHGEIIRRESKLNETLDLIKEKDARLQETHQRCIALEDQSHQTESEKNELQVTVKTLKSELDESKQKIQGLKDKQRIYKSKLNEAIEEQQSLYTRCREDHEQTRQQLEKEKATRATDYKAVEKALKVSHKTRGELKACFEQFREQTKQDSQKKDEVLADLRQSMNNKEEELARERDTILELRRRIKEQAKLQDMVERVESQVHSISDNNTKRELESQHQKEVVDHLSAKLDLILESLSTPNCDAITPTTIEENLEKLEGRILSRLLPEVLSVASEQSRIEASTLDWRINFQNEVEDLKLSLKENIAAQPPTQQNNEVILKDHLDRLSQIDVRTISIERAQEKIEQCVFEWTHQQDLLQSRSDSILQKEIAEQLNIRESVISSLEGNVVSVAAQFNKKFEEIEKLIIQSNESSNKGLEEQLTAIETALTDGFDKERLKSENALAQSEAVHLALEAIVQKLQKTQQPSSSEVDSDEHVQAVGSKEEMVSELQKQIHQLQHESKTVNDLRNRWLKDIKAMDMIKSQLKDMSERLPRLENAEARFQHMADINHIIHSTASYLTAEHSWISQYLEERPESGSPAIDSKKLTGSQETIVVKEETTETPVSRSIMTTFKEKSIELGDASSQVSPKEESLRRKVIVNSPRGFTTSPSPPPSIRQEKLRRREAAAPRSILRSSGSTSQETLQSLPETVTPHNHTQYNRPVMGGISSAASGTNQVVIEEIRSNLVQNIPLKAGWNLPMMVDFEPKSQPNAIISNKKHTIVIQDQAQGPCPKKVKVKDETSQVATNLNNRRPQIGPVKRPRVFKTYSCRNAELSPELTASIDNPNQQE